MLAARNFLPILILPGENLGHPPHVGVPRSPCDVAGCFDGALMSSGLFAFGNNSKKFKELEFGIWDPVANIQDLRDAIQCYPDIRKLSLKANIAIRSEPRWNLPSGNLRRWMSICN